MVMTERPYSLPTVSQRIRTGYGRVYVNITYHRYEDEDEVDDSAPGEPFEVFIKTGNSGGFTNAWCEALGIAISWGLRSGADASDVADYLVDIRMDNVGHDNGDEICSIPAAAGVALRRFIDGEIEEVLPP